MQGPSPFSRGAVHVPPRHRRLRRIPRSPAKALAGHLAGLGAGVEVLEPPEVRQWLARLGAELTATYAGEAGETGESAGTPHAPHAPDVPDAPDAPPAQ
ncbi:hypothetical protein ACWDA9_29865 [Streptomyces sp. NPDC001193]